MAVKSAAVAVPGAEVIFTLAAPSKPSVRRMVTVLVPATFVHQVDGGTQHEGAFLHLVGADIRHALDGLAALVGGDGGNEHGGGVARGAAREQGHGLRGAAVAGQDVEQRIGGVVRRAADARTGTIAVQGGDQNWRRPGRLNPELVL